MIGWLQGEEAFGRPDPDPIVGCHLPQKGRERPAGNSSNQEFEFARGRGGSCGRGGGVGALQEISVDLQPKGEILAGLEDRHPCVGADAKASD
jgi:hypothetical protein